MILESERSMASHRDKKNNSLLVYSISPEVGYCTIFPPDLSSIALTSQLGKLRSPHDAYQYVPIAHSLPPFISRHRQSLLTTTST